MNEYSQYLHITQIKNTNKIWEDGTNLTIIGSDNG